MTTISIIGSGRMATAIGGLAAKAGHRVEVMSRDPAKGQALAGEIGEGATTGMFGAAPAGDIVILAIPYAVVLDVVKQYGAGLAGKRVVDITNPVASDLESFVTPKDSCGAQEIARIAPPMPRSSRHSTPTSPTSWPRGRLKAALWTCSSPGTTPRQRHASRHSSKAWDYAR
jgi:predicted dinucleotide-binding enzyme